MLDSRKSGNMKKRKLESKDETPNKQSKLSNNVENGIDNDEPVSKKCTNFSIADFRSKLRSVDGLKCLRDFASSAEDSDIILEYLKSGGTLSEIVSLLDITAQGDLATALPVFRTVNLIILRIQTDGNEYAEEAQQSIEHILSSFVPTIQSMIAMNSPKHRKVVLKFLTAIVTFRASFGSQTLNWLNITPQQQEQLTEPGPVRKAFIMFLLSFFVEGRVNLFRPLLEKKGLLSAVLPNLKYDDENTVAIFLTVLKDKLLANPKVLKTLKLNIFNTQAIQCLLGLYDWIGPKGVQKGWKKPKKLPAADEASLMVVTSALNDFLEVLCTCRRNGLVFWDKSLGTGLPLNQVIFTAIEVIPKPWKKTETSNLVLKILKSAPDLIKPCLSRWESSFEPRDSIVWLQSINFLIELIQSIDCDQIASAAMEGLTKSQFQSALRGMLLNPPILTHIKSALSSNSSLAIRSHVLRLLITIMRKFTQIFPVITNSALCSDSFKKNIIHPLFAVIPDVKGISEIWNAADNETVSPIQPDVAIDEICANFILAIAQLDVTLIDNPRRLCKTLIETINEKSSDVQSAVLQAISLLEPDYLTPQSEQFETALEILLLLSSDSSNRQGALAALFSMLLNTGLWDSQPQELDSWLGVWLRVKPSCRQIISKIFISSICCAALNNTQGKNASVYSEVVKASEETIKELKKSERMEVKIFITDLSLQLGCFPESSLASVENAKVVLLDVQSCLRGDKTAAALIPNKLEKEFVSWMLNNDEEPISIDSDSFQLFSLFNFAINFLREWLKEKQFNKIRQNKCHRSLELILKDANSKVPKFKENAKYFLSLNTTQATFMNKVLKTIFRDVSLIGEFSIIEENVFTPWLKELILKMEWEKKSIDSKLLLPWKNSFILQLRKILRFKKDMSLVADDICFWLSFVKPSVDDLTGILSNICSSSAGNISQSASFEAFGTLWLAAVKVLGKSNAPFVLISDMVRCLSKISLVPHCKPDNVSALVQLLNNFPLAILDVPKDFLKVALVKQDMSYSLIEICSLCTLKLSHKKMFISIFCNSIDAINVNAAVAILDYLRQQALSLNKEMVSDNFVEKIDKRMLNAMPNLSKRCWRSLRSFICGVENNVFARHLPVTRFLIQQLGSNERKVKKIISALNGNHPRLEVFLTVADIVHEQNTELLSDWLRQLCQQTEENCQDWSKQSEIIVVLAKNSKYRPNFKLLTESKIWMKFLRLTLRNFKVTSDNSYLAALCAVLESSFTAEKDNRVLEDIFHKCTSHSEFLPIMLSDASIKAEVVKLLLILVRLCPQVMVLGHIPLYLSAYSGTLSSNDQNLLQILREYEQHCGSLSKFDPLFWGQPAVSHYSVKGNSGLSLWKQVSMKNVLQLLSIDKVKETIADFPIERQLKGENVKPRHNLYDPAFLMPLFSNLFSPGAVTYCLSFIHKGALSLTIAALSSADSHMRGAAVVVLSRFYSHLQLVQHFKQKPVWLHFLDCIRFGCENIESQPIASIVTVFLARTVLEVSDPQASLYTLHRYLIAKPVFNLHTYPEFISLFYSEDLHYTAHRKWILEVLRDGIRSHVDVILALKSSSIKLLLISFNLPTTPIEIKNIILQILQRIFSVDSVPETVVVDLGLLPWLRHACRIIQEPLVPAFILLFQTILLYFRKVEKGLGKLGKRIRLVFECENTLGGYLSSVGHLESAIKMLETPINTVSLVC